MTKTTIPFFIAGTFIRYDRITGDYAVWADDQIVAYGRTYLEAEQKRTAYLAERLGRAQEATT